MAEILLLYRLIILYLLAKANLPLSNTQITSFMLDMEYTSYFRIQQSFMDLMSSDLITAESTHNNTLYQITDEGRRTLDFFQDKISGSIKRDVTLYLESNHYELKNEAYVNADFYRTGKGTYAAHCQIKSSDRPILELTLDVSTAEQAEAICQNWNAQHIEVYTSLMDLLLQ